MTAPARPRPAPPREPHAAPGLLVPGGNCWRIETSTRTRLVQDAAAYFELARDAILRAEHSIFVLGWDIYAGLDLVPGGAADGAPTRLAELLDFAVRRRRRLRCFVLVWDHSALYALERDPFTRLKLGWMTHRRVHFRYDDQHPLGGSHHEKMLVVDDALAFAGSIDFTTHRWDTTAHRLDEPHRKNSMGQPYEPYHDVQLMVEGPAAAALGELAREHWRRVRLRRRRLPPVRSGGGPGPWPEGVASDLPPAPVAISRTDPSFRDRSDVRECEALYFDAIAAATRTIYLENQYFTDARIAEALAARLREPDGPEVVVVGPQQCSGWLERNTMGVLRGVVLRTLADADLHGRLRVLHPMASRSAGVPTFVHSKVMFVDDELMRVGSANLAARSMGMDSECDLTAVANGDPGVRAGISAALDRLLAEHLGAGEADVRQARERGGSLRAAIDALSGGDRSLVPLDATSPPSSDTATETMRELVDPAEPIGFVRRLGDALPELEVGQMRGRFAARALPLSVLAIGSIAAWRADWLGGDRTLADLDSLLEVAPTTPALVLGVVASFVVSGLVFLPINVLAFAAAVLLGPGTGSACAAGGAAVAAAAGYAVGRTLSPPRLASWIGHRVYRLLRVLHRPTAWSIAALRVIPIASSTTIHLLCGTARVPVRAYAAGTSLGLLPPLAAAAVTGGLVRAALLDASWVAGLVGFGMAMVWVALMLRLRRLLLQQHVDLAMQEQGERSAFG